MQSLAERIAHLAPQQRAALEELLKRQGTEKPSPRPREDDAVHSYESSFAQQQLWFLDQLEPGQATYNIAAVVQFRGPLIPAALRQALEAVVDRQLSLRTFFVNQGGKPQAQLASVKS